MMNRRRRTKILIEGDQQLAMELADSILAKYEWNEIVSPRYGLTMVKMRETAQNSLFYIGEVLVTEAKAEIGDAIGIGIVAGMEDELARQLAVIDAAYAANLPETSEWLPILEEAEKNLIVQKAREQARNAQTKVSFETMDVN